MTNLKTYRHSYAFDKGMNLIQRSANSGNRSRMIATTRANRAISHKLYQSLNLTPTEQANLNEALLGKGIFDPHGNQLKTKTGQVLTWDYQNMLQTTTTAQADGSTLAEYNTYAKAGQRNCKVTEKKDQDSNTTEITESLYLSNLEYRTIWKGENLSYDGETVTEQSTGAMVIPHEQYSTLRIRQGHKQAAQKKNYRYKEGIKVVDQTTSYSLDNNIDSCELTLGRSGHLESYESYKLYGETAISYGKTRQQRYKYSGQEKDKSGLYYYGFRSLDPEIFRWTSPDPTGLQGSGLNWYVLVGQNPLTRRDRNGLGPFPFKRLFGDFAKQMLKSSFIGIGGIGLNHVNDRKRGLQKNDEQNLAFGTITTDYYVGILNVETDSNYYKTQTIDEKIELVTGAISAFNKKVVDDRSVRNSNNISRSIFAAPEYAFTSSTEKKRTLSSNQKIVNHFHEVAQQYTNMIIVPGTTVWYDSKTDTLRNQALVFYNTRIFFQDKMWESNEALKMDKGKDGKRLGLYGATTYRNAKVRSKTWNVDDLVVGVEICLDHKKAEMLQYLNIKEKSLDVHVIVSNSINFYKDNTRLNKGGIVLHADGGFNNSAAYKKGDHGKIEKQEEYAIIGDENESNVELLIYKITKNGR